MEEIVTAAAGAAVVAVLLVLVVLAPLELVNFVVAVQSSRDPILE